MDPNHVLIRTAKGQEEIRSRVYNLSPHLHRVLIEIDEHCTVGETLARLAESGGEAMKELEGLLVEGFVALRHSPWEMAAYSLDEWCEYTDEYGSPEDAAPAGVPIHHHAPFNLEKAKGFARFVLLGALGPAASHRVERIDSARDVHELRAELDALRDQLPKLLSHRQADDLWAQLEPLMLSVE
jgi:hypothetical protein